MSDKTVYVVHCIDTEGPLYESLGATFQRVKSAFGFDIEPTRENLRRLQKKEIDLGGQEDAVAMMTNPNLLRYHDTWTSLDKMLDNIMSREFRDKMLDSYGTGWSYNWFCVDHVGYEINPRRRDMGYHNIFDHYREFVEPEWKGVDGLHFHYHPKPFNRFAHHNATHYFAHSDTLFKTLARRIIDRGWFPCANRPGFHVNRPDSHWFFEQYVPFDYSNQSFEGIQDQPDVAEGRLGDWRRAPRTWQPYQPDHDDYQKPGACRRWIMRCLNVGTRYANITQKDVDQAFEEAGEGKPSILAFTNHDFRDMTPDVETVRELLIEAAGKYPDVKFKFSEARDAVRGALNLPHKDPCRFELRMEGDRLSIKSDSSTFGPQPFLALKTVTGDYYHDNLDFQTPFREWTYTFDNETFPPRAIESVGVGSCDAYGNVTAAVMDMESGETKVTYN